MEGVNKKIIYGVVAILAIIILVYLIFVFQKEKAPQRIEVSYTGLELAEKIAGFLEKTQNEDGSFNLVYTCSALFEEGCASEPIEGPLHSGQIILAFYDLFKATGDQKYKEKADFGMGFVMERCPKDPQMCQWNFFPLYEYYKDTKDPKYLEGMLAVSEELLAEKSFNDFVDANFGVKLAMLYEVTGDSRYRDRLDQAAKEALNLEKALIDNGNQLIYTTENGFQVRARALATIWGTLIPAYKATGKSEYLQVSQDFFDKAETASHIGSYAVGEFYLGILTLIKALDALVDTAELSPGQNNYLEQARLLTQELLQGRIDMKEAPKFTGDYGFLRVRCNSEQNYKDVLHSGWLARLLLRMGGDYTIRPY